MRASLSFRAPLLRRTRPHTLPPSHMRIVSHPKSSQLLKRQRTFHTSSPTLQTSISEPKTQSRHYGFYTTHGRALLKAFTLAFFTYQIMYYAWMTLETEETKDQKTREIKSLEGEVRLLDEGRRSHGGDERPTMGEVRKR